MFIGQPLPGFKLLLLVGVSFIPFLVQLPISRWNRPKVSCIRKLVQEVHINVSLASIPSIRCTPPCPAEQILAPAHLCVCPGFVGILTSLLNSQPAHKHDRTTSGAQLSLRMQFWVCSYRWNTEHMTFTLLKLLFLIPLFLA